MTIAYLIDYDINSNSGVLTKIFQQSQQWILKGYTVYYVSTKTLAIYDSNKNLMKQLKPLNINMKRVGTALKLLYSSYHLDRLLKNIDFDILYMRYMLFMPFLSKVLKKHKVIMEINADDTIEFKLHSKITHYYNKMTRNLVLKKVDAFVSVSHELKLRFAYLNKPIIVIANGINAHKIDFVENKNKKPILVFISTPNQPWQGFEKIVKMADKLDDFLFYIIGLEGKSEKNIKYFGYLSNEESSKIIQKCDIGIGTLSSYKNGLDEASPLKTRQYLACGLPIIYAYEDTDIPKNSEFVLQFKNKENNINLKEVELFVQNVFNNHAIRKKAKEFANTVLDSSVKEMQRIDYFKKIINEKPTTL